MSGLHKWQKRSSLKILSSFACILQFPPPLERMKRQDQLKCVCVLSINCFPMKPNLILGRRGQMQSRRYGYGEERSRIFEQEEHESVI